MKGEWCSSEGSLLRRGSLFFAQVCGPRGCGRSALCRAVCLDVTRRLGVFTLVRGALAAAFEAAAANKASIVLLEDLVSDALHARLPHPLPCTEMRLWSPYLGFDSNSFVSLVVFITQDVLCFSAEDGGDRHSVAEARGSLLASFLHDAINRVSGAQTLAHSCARGNLGGAAQSPNAACKVLTLATAVDASALHPTLAHPLLFGSSKLHMRCDTSLVGARVELLKALLELVTASLPNSKAFTSLMETPEDSDSPIRDNIPLTEAQLWNVANKLEGYSLADLKAVVTRAVGESLLSRPVELSRHLNMNWWQVRDSGRQQAVLHYSHLLKAAEEVQPRATQQQSFIQPDLRYCHVGGMHRAKEDLQDLLTLQRSYPSLLKASGISVHQGVLLVGPPGCGKTHLALAAVGEAQIRCIHVKGPELLGKFIGSSEAAVKAVFQRAEAAKPCAILFDEIEALATKRGGDTTGVTDRVVNQLLCYLDGIETREDVFVIATTSRPDLVDAALLRPGRLEKASQRDTSEGDTVIKLWDETTKVCFCGLPLSEAERTEILAVSLKSLNADCSFDVETMGHAVPWTFSPADIQAVVNQAQTHAVQEVLAAEPDEQETHYPETVTIDERHFLAALECSRPSLSVHRYHRYCLPFLSRAYQEQVHTVERLITLSAKQTKANVIDKIVGSQSLNSLPSDHILSVTQTTEEGLRVKGSESNCMHEGVFLESLTKPSSSEPGDEAGSGESAGSSPANAAHHSPSNLTEGLCTKKQPKRRRRKRTLAQLPGNQVALA
ncbi:hypothetical protein Emed_002466 [Eimeria media]